MNSTPTAALKTAISRQRDSRLLNLSVLSQKDSETRHQGQPLVGQDPLDPGDATILDVVLIT